MTLKALQTLERSVKKIDTTFPLIIYQILGIKENH